MSRAPATGREVTFRPARPADDAFLRELFASSRDDLAPLPDEVRGPLTDLQYRVRDQHYAVAYPQARQLIVTVDDGAPVGRLVVHDGEVETRLVDVAIAIEHRGRGLGTAAVRHVLAGAAVRGTTVTLSVWSADRTARALYERLGFHYLSTGNGYLPMTVARTSEVVA